MLWISTFMGNLYKVDPQRLKIPFVEIKVEEINAFMKMMIIQCG
jgi:hypothetical protein